MFKDSKENYVKGIGAWFSNSINSKDIVCSEEITLIYLFIYFSPQKTNKKRLALLNVFLFIFSNMEAIPLDKIIIGEEKSITFLHESLSQRGWAFIKLPIAFSKLSEELLENANSFFSKSTDYKNSFQYHRYGFVESGSKQAIRILTGDIVKLMKLPEDVSLSKFCTTINKKDLRRISEILDSTCKRIIQQCSSRIFGHLMHNLGTFSTFSF